LILVVVLGVLSIVIVAAVGAFKHDNIRAPAGPTSGNTQRSEAYFLVSPSCLRHRDR